MIAIAEPENSTLMEVRHDVGVLQLDIDRQFSDSTNPLKPPMVKSSTNASGNSIGVSNVIEPRHSVATQLKTFTPVGMAMSIVVHEEQLPADRRRWWAWCAQTMNEESDRRHGVDHRHVAEQGLAREGRMIVETMPRPAGS